MHPRFQKSGGGGEHARTVISAKKRRKLLDSLGGTGKGKSLDNAPGKEIARWGSSSALRLEVLLPRTESERVAKIKLKKTEG